MSSSSARLSLRALLHYLWDQAELTRWHPGFEGRRSWGVVRRQLLQAAAQMIACGDTLLTRLDIPEPFSVDHREAISARRLARWSAATSTSDGKQSMLVLIAEAKAIVPARYGHKAIVKHVPDFSFALDDSLYQRIGRLFEREITLWNASDAIHLIIIATVAISQECQPRFVELSLMTVTEHWLPVENMAEIQLVTRLTRNRCSFSKMLRYDLRPDAHVPSLVLRDEPDRARAVFAAE